ncbi:hypothetical protein Pmar_PMAR022748 [Perkinsus marinus ATCC 50983]|uniref:HTTM domain-containing protein n=1 Tax=Perkinsus marinus (strain ATCC 50983 / TXsc) TaxID=423536 RepID=C5LTH1_PERM5|nr:hypothetical protein Pmar_PMAR022748 [Perkinsus marinus ATCC 50983]EEQ99962.1 hypothetical protein Pmar_PMAR022748 [Perkinsus marinus ATCC 50983]|eukprot:XP_002767245.1 hypothetical protein Pmar_PMAR022748 [Perkinsus marinus ATCC 50983]
MPSGLSWLTGRADAGPFMLYRRCFGFVIVLEILWFSDHAAEIMSQGFSPVAPAELPFDVPLTPLSLDLALVVGCFMSVCFVALEPSCWTSAPLLIVYAYLRISDFTNWNNHYYLNILELSLFTITDFEYSPRGLNDDVSRVTELSRRGPEMMDTAESLLMTSEEQTGFDASHGLSGEPESLLSSSDHDKELRRFLVHTVPSWFYFAFRFLICWTYFMAGMSKISEAWLSGYITETMLHNWDFPLVHMLADSAAGDIEVLREKTHDYVMRTQDDASRLMRWAALIGEQMQKDGQHLVDQIAEQAVHSQKLAQKMVDTATKQALMAHTLATKSLDAARKAEFAKAMQHLADEPKKASFAVSPGTPYDSHAVIID